MKKFASLTAMFFVVAGASAQLTYQNNALTFNGAMWNGCSTTWNGWAHAFVGGGKIVNINLSPADPRIGTNTDKIVFFKCDNTGFIDAYARNFYTSSDIDFKVNIQPLPFGTATGTVLRLKPVTFQWKDHAEYMRLNPRSTGITNARKFGFLAQDVERVLPDIVAVDGEGNRLVNY
jgi:hypothetical protein